MAPITHSSESVVKGFITLFEEYAQTKTYKGKEVPHFQTDYEIARAYVDRNAPLITKETRERLDRVARAALEKFKANPILLAATPEDLTQRTVSPLDPSTPPTIQHLFPGTRVKEIRRPSPLHPVNLIVGGLVGVALGYTLIFARNSFCGLYGCSQVPYDLSSFPANFAQGVFLNSAIYYLNPSDLVIGTAAGAALSYGFNFLKNGALHFLGRSAVPYTFIDLINGLSTCGGQSLRLRSFFSSQLNPKAAPDKYWSPVLDTPQGFAKKNNREIGTLATFEQGGQEVSFAFTTRPNEQGTECNYRSTGKGKTIHEDLDQTIARFDKTQPIAFSIRLFHPT